MRRAWEAVQKSGVPEALQETALREAVEFLRVQELGAVPADAATSTAAKRTATGKRSGSRKTSPPKGKAAQPKASVPDEGTFFAQLAEESGVDEQDLRDVLQVTAQGVVHIAPPTRNLGGSRAEQAKSVIALVAGARAYGLGEDPVDAEAVRDEAKRKRCFDPNNFAAKSLTPMKGFNAGSTRAEIVLTSKWVDEFKSAADKALGRKPTKDQQASES